MIVPEVLVQLPVKVCVHAGALAQEQPLAGEFLELSHLLADGRLGEPEFTGSL